MILVCGALLLLMTAVGLAFRPAWAGAMLFWWVRYTEPPMPVAGTKLVNLPDAADRHPAIASPI